ncbi:MAG: hypothetical protein AAF654_05745 [Myxococcota bacterium]
MSSYVKIVSGLPALLDSLRAFPDIGSGRYPASQDLVYQGQLARGLFLVLRGMIYLRARAHGATVASSLETDRGFGILVPAIEQLNRALPATIATARQCEIIFISRMRLRTSPDLADIISQTSESLREPLEVLEN